MTISTTLPPPKTVPWFTCTEKHCNKMFQPYHGKVGCKCYTCDTLTPARVAGGRQLIKRDY